jgi:nucleotide-binding universal stress UspA family protein
MMVAVAHRGSATSRVVLTEAARQASLRGTGLAVIHVTASALDADTVEAYRAGISDEVERVFGTDPTVPWQLFLRTTRAEDVGAEILALADEIGAELLVIGARRRSPVGKALLGSITQTVILEANMPVLVVKGSG